MAKKKKQKRIDYGSGEYKGQLKMIMKERVIKDCKMSGRDVKLVERFRFLNEKFHAVGAFDVFDIETGCYATHDDNEFVHFYIHIKALEESDGQLKLEEG